MKTWLRTGNINGEHYVMSRVQDTAVVDTGGV